MEAANSDSIKYLDGFGLHWYWDKFAPPQFLDETKIKYPNKFLLNTESSIGK